MKFTLIFGLALAVLALLFALQNTNEVSLVFFTMQFSGSVAAVTIVTLIVGVLSGFLLLLPQIVGSTFLTRNLKKENKTLKKKADGDQSKNQGDLYQNLSHENIPEQKSEILVDDNTQV